MTIRSSRMKHRRVVAVGGGSPSARFWRIFITATVTQPDVHSAIQEMELAVTVGGADETTPALAPARASASSAFDAFTLAEKAFNGALINPSLDAWTASAATVPQWLAWDFGVGSEKAIAEVRILPQRFPPGPGRGPSDFLIQNSEDGVLYFTVKSFVGVSGYALDVFKTFEI